jgi:hypothetical protein
MSESWRIKLSRAALHENVVKNPKSVEDLFSCVTPGLEKAEKIGTKIVSDLSVCDNALRYLIMLKKSGHSRDSMYKSALKEFFKLMGEVQAGSVYMDIRLLEYRSLFERVNAN